jgi:hypothetical protein
VLPDFPLKSGKYTSARLSPFRARSRLPPFTLTMWDRHAADSDAESVWARGRGWAARLEQEESSTLSLIVRLVDDDIRKLVLGGLLRWFSAMASHILSTDWKKAVLHNMSKTGARPNGILIPKDVEILKHEDGSDRVLNSGASPKVGMRISPTPARVRAWVYRVPWISICGRKLPIVAEKTPSGQVKHTAKVGGACQEFINSVCMLWLSEFLFLGNTEGPRESD